MQYALVSLLFMIGAASSPIYRDFGNPVEDEAKRANNVNMGLTHVDVQHTGTGRAWDVATTYVWPTGRAEPTVTASSAPPCDDPQVKRTINNVNMGFTRVDAHHTGTGGPWDVAATYVWPTGRAEPTVATQPNTAGSSPAFVPTPTGPANDQTQTTNNQGGGQGMGHHHHHHANSTVVRRHHHHDEDADTNASASATANTNANDNANTDVDADTDTDTDTVIPTAARAAPSAFPTDFLDGDSGDSYSSEMDSLYSELESLLMDLTGEAPYASATGGAVTGGDDNGFAWTDVMPTAAAAAPAVGVAGGSIPAAPVAAAAPTAVITAAPSSGDKGEDDWGWGDGHGHGHNCNQGPGQINGQGVDQANGQSQGQVNSPGYDQSQGQANGQVNGQVNAQANGQGSGPTLETITIGDATITIEWVSNGPFATVAPAPTPTGGPF